MNISLPSIFSHGLGLALGAAIFWLFGWWQAGIPASGKPLETPVHIKLAKIAPADDWIANFEVDVVNLGDIQSQREYLLLILRKKSNDTKLTHSGQLSRFVLTWKSNPETKLVFGIDPSQLDSSQDFQTLLVDFGGNLFRKNRIRLPLSDLELSSRILAY